MQGPLDEISQAIGNTPMVRLARMFPEAEVLAKCEFLNPGGSVKDRIAARMIDEAEKQGRIKPGDILVEPTSGNTGLGMAMVGAARGYRVVIVMPAKMSMEKQIALEALGAQIIRTRTEAAFDDPDSHISVSQMIVDRYEDAHMLDQYVNPANPDAHYHGTGREIVEQAGEFDAFVCSAGTGGTITGCAKRFKEAGTGCKIIGVDPVGSILAGGEVGDPYLVEGIGYDFIPDVLENDLVDEYVKTEDGPSFAEARKLIRTEGLLVGGSSGSAILGVRHALRQGHHRVVVILPDSIRNYIRKFAHDGWMRDHGFEPPEKTQYVESPIEEATPADAV